MCFTKERCYGWGLCTTSQLRRGCCRVGHAAVKIKLDMLAHAQAAICTEQGANSRLDSMGRFGDGKQPLKDV